MMLGSSGDCHGRKWRDTLSAVRRLLAMCALSVLALAVAISIAAAYAYPNAGNSPWQFSKAGKTSEAGIEGAGEIFITQKPAPLYDPHFESGSLPPHEPHIQKLPELLRAYHFRPPPAELS